MSPTDIPSFLTEGVPSILAVGSSLVRAPRAARHMARVKKSPMERFDELIAKAREIKFNLDFQFAY